MSLRAWLFVYLVLASGAVLSLLALPDLTQPNLMWLELLILTALATTSQLIEAVRTSRQAYYPHLVFFFAGLIMLPPLFFVVLIVIPHLVEWLKKRLTNSDTLNKWYIQPFNIAAHIIAGQAARTLYIGLQSNSNLLHSQFWVFIVLLVALVYIVGLNVQVGLALFLARGISLNKSNILSVENLMPEFILAGLGYIIAVLWLLNPWLLVPALSPLVLMYQALMVPQLKQEAQTDAKTGLLNARYFNKMFSSELDRARRFNRPLSVIMADLDLMRNINNTYGHLAGDAVLSGIGKIIQDTLREYDIAGRFGGEEFAIVLPEVDLAEARLLAERLRVAIAEAVFTGPNCPEVPIQATMSLGFACFPQDALTLTNLIQMADVAVYEAKHTGRNRVVWSGDVPLAVREACQQLEDSYKP